MSREPGRRRRTIVAVSCCSGESVELWRLSECCGVLPAMGIRRPFTFTFLPQFLVPAVVELLDVKALSRAAPLGLPRPVHGSQPDLAL